MRDLASLNKTELLPWDSWGLVDKEDKDLAPADWQVLDHAAELTLADNSMFDQVRSFYLDDDCLRVPAVIKSYTSAGVRSEEWAADQVLVTPSS